MRSMNLSRLLIVLVLVGIVRRCIKCDAAQISGAKSALMLRSTVMSK